MTFRICLNTAVVQILVSVSAAPFYKHILAACLFKVSAVFIIDKHFIVSCSIFHPDLINRGVLHPNSQFLLGIESIQAGQLPISFHLFHGQQVGVCELHLSGCGGILLDVQQLKQMGEQHLALAVHVPLIVAIVEIDGIDHAPHREALGHEHDGVAGGFGGQHVHGGIIGEVGGADRGVARGDDVALRFLRGLFGFGGRIGGAVLAQLDDDLFGGRLGVLSDCFPGVLGFLCGGRGIVHQPHPDFHGLQGVDLLGVLRRALHDFDVEESSQGDHLVSGQPCFNLRPVFLVFRHFGHGKHSPVRYPCIRAIGHFNFVIFAIGGENICLQLSGNHHCIHGEGIGGKSDGRHLRLHRRSLHHTGLAFIVQVDNDGIPVLLDLLLHGHDNGNRYFRLDLLPVSIPKADVHGVNALNLDEIPGHAVRDAADGLIIHHVGHLHGGPRRERAGVSGDGHIHIFRRSGERLRRAGIDPVQQRDRIMAVHDDIRGIEIRNDIDGIVGHGLAIHHRREAEQSAIVIDGGIVLHSLGDNHVVVLILRLLLTQIHNNFFGGGFNVQRFNAISCQRLKLAVSRLSFKGMRVLRDLFLNSLQLRDIGFLSHSPFSFHFADNLPKRQGNRFNLGQVNDRMESVCDHLRLLFLLFNRDIVTLGVRFAGLIFGRRFISPISDSRFTGLSFVLSALYRFVFYRRVAFFISVSVDTCPLISCFFVRLAFVGLFLFALCRRGHSLLLFALGRNCFSLFL